MDWKTHQEKILEAYRQKQLRIAALLSSIQNKLEKHAGQAIDWGHVGDLGHVAEMLNEIDIFLD